MFVNKTNVYILVTFLLIPKGFFVCFVFAVEKLESLYCQNHARRMGKLLLQKSPNSSMAYIQRVLGSQGEQICRSANRTSFNWRNLELDHLW